MLQICMVQFCVERGAEMDSRNVLVRGLPQSLYALCRWYMTEGTAPEDMLAVLVSP